MKKNKSYRRRVSACYPPPLSHPILRRCGVEGGGTRSGGGGRSGELSHRTVPRGTGKLSGLDRSLQGRDYLSSRVMIRAI